jgi:hypothetical protein
MHKSQWNISNGRSAAFSEYLSQQTPERRREIAAAEQAYLQSANSPTAKQVAAATDYAQGLRGPSYQFPVSRLLDRVDAA